MVTAPELPVPLEPGTLVRWLRGRNVWQLVGLTVLADVAGRLLVAWLLVGLLGVKPDLGKDAPSPLDVMKDGWLLVLFLAVAPLLETLIFQVGMQGGLGRLRVFRHRPGVLILLTGVTFAVQHFYSAFYMAVILPAGLLFAAVFHALGKGWRAFWVVVLAHACINGLVTVVGLISHAAS